MGSTAETAIPINSLFPDRYDLGKSIIYQAIKDLNLPRIKAEKGQTAYISFEHLAVLDSYIAVRKSEGTAAADAFAAAYVSSKAESFTEDSSAIAPGGSERIVPLTSAENSTAPSFFLEAIALVEGMIQRGLILPRSDALAPQRQLKEAAAEGWLLSTAQIRDIVGVQSWHGAPRYGFRFDQAGKIGAQTGWLVLREEAQRPG